MKTTKLSRKMLPGSLRDVSNKMKFGINVLGTRNGKPESVGVWDVSWGGGSFSMYDVLDIETGRLQTLRGLKDGDQLVPKEGTAIIITGRYCGKDAGVSVYLNDADVPAFLGLHPNPDRMPGVILADQIEERAYELVPGLASCAAAELLRTVCV